MDFEEAKINANGKPVSRPSKSNSEGQMEVENSFKNNI